MAATQHDALQVVLNSIQEQEKDLGRSLTSALQEGNINSAALAGSGLGATVKLRRVVEQLLKETEGEIKLATK